MNDKKMLINQFRFYMKRSDRINNNAMSWLCDHGFFDAPASSKHHLSCEGGLAMHSLAVAYELICLTEDLRSTWDREDSPIIVGLFHDLCKIDQYIRQKDGTYIYNGNTALKGHGDKSVVLLSRLMPLTEEETMCIRYHMGAFSDDAKERSAYSDAVKKYPNVLFTHTADMIASQVKGT